MTVRDLGYRPYVGKRLPTSNNVWVLLRHCLRRASRSWLVRIAVFSCWTVLLAAGFARAFELPVWSVVFRYLIWIPVALVSLGSGSVAIADDLRNGIFRFYFVKPTTPAQYLAGQIGAVALTCFAVTFIPAAATGILLSILSAANDPNFTPLEAYGVLFPAATSSIFTSAIVACLSVGISSLSSSRAITMGVWLVLFIVPHVLGNMVHATALLRSQGTSGWPWLLLASVPTLLAEVNDAIFKIQSDSALHWSQALTVLITAALFAVLGALKRLEQAEVVR
ncbi:MAG: hypothetical protein AAF355_12680 [Myxococcota bacterium]